MAIKKQAITAAQVAELAGSKNIKTYVSNKLLTDKTFPRPIIAQANGKNYWFKHEIVVWLAKDAAEPRDAKGRKLSGVQKAAAASRAARTAEVAGLDLSLTNQIINAQAVDVAAL